MRTRFQRSFRWWWVSAALVQCAGQAPAQPATATNVAATAIDKVSALSNAAQLSLGLDRVPWLDYTLFKIPLWQYLAVVVYVVLAFLVSKVLDYLIGVRLKKWAARTETKWDDLLVAVLHGPTKVVAFVVLLHVGFNVFPWPSWLANYLSKGLVIVVAISLTYVALKLVDALLGYWAQGAAERSGDRLLDQQLLPVLRITARVFVVIVAILLTTQNLGLNITSLIASLSIGGLAMGLAAQDTLANLFGAFSVFVDRPFRVGERIRIDSVDGTVESIGLRSTRVRNLEGHLVTIPNKTMGNATITNVTRRPNLKTEINIGLTYDTSMEKLKQALAILDEIYRNHPRTADLVISFNKFADSSLNILVVHFWRGTDYKQYMADLQKLNLAIKEQFEKAGIEFAFPSQMHYVKQIP
jgi:MscS family membrane protein